MTDDLVPVYLRGEHFHIKPAFIVLLKLIAQFNLLSEHTLWTVVDWLELGVNGVGAIATVVEAVRTCSQSAFFCLEVPGSGIHV